MRSLRAEAERDGSIRVPPSCDERLLMAGPKVVVLGGGLSGIAAAYALKRAGWSDVTVVERGRDLGGLAGSFEKDGHVYPLGYHHILHRDRPLHYFLDAVGALSRVRWRRTRMLFRTGQRLYDLAHPVDFLRYPMSLVDKARFVRLMLRAFFKDDWSDWLDRDAETLVDAWGGPGVREAMFEPLCRLKFDLPAREVSGAWLGARLHHREGSSAFGYIPHANWTRVLCDGLSRLLAEQGVAIRTEATVGRLETAGGRLAAAVLDSGERLEGELFVSTIPTEVYHRLLPDDATPGFATIRYTALVSTTCATRTPVAPDFYWLNMMTLDRTASGLFRLEKLNPTIGAPGETTLNFVTHLPSRERPLFLQPDEDLLAAYHADFRAVFGHDFEPSWCHVVRVPLYSPVFRPGYRNPPVRSTSLANVYFAGNYRTFPSVVSTGNALASGLETGRAVLREHGLDSPLLAEAQAFRVPSRPAG